MQISPNHNRLVAGKRWHAAKTDSNSDQRHDGRKKEETDNGVRSPQIEDKESYRQEEGEFVKKMALARERDQDRFCSLFGHPELSFQLLREYYLKEMYCESCQ